jgi:hypothetical protein
LVNSATYYCPDHNAKIQAKRRGRGYSVLRQKEQREQGLCGYIGCPEHTGDLTYYCADHAQRRVKAADE